MLEKESINLANYFSIIFDSIPAFIFFKDCNNIFLHVNQALAKIMDKNQDQIIGKSAFDLYPKELAQKYWQDDMQVIGSGIAMRDIIEPIDTQKGRLIVKTDKLPLKNSKGEIIGIIGFSLDITETINIQERLRETEERFRRAFETAAIGMALVSIKGEFIKVNKSLSDIVGYTQDELLAKNFQDITYPEDLAQDLEQLNILIKGDIHYYNMQKRYIHKNGKIIWILLSVSLVRDINNSPLYFVTQVQDITTTKEQEELLKKKVESLERFQKITVDRELKMVELKQQIEQLKLELKK